MERLFFSEIESARLHRSVHAKEVDITKSYNTGFRRRVGAGRTLLRLPFNVVMEARIHGNVDGNRPAEGLQQI